MPANTQLQIRRGLSSLWASVNSTLAAGEIGHETDTGRIKIGDGTTQWNSLPYSFAKYTDIVTGSGINASYLTDVGGRVTGVQILNNIKAGANIALTLDTNDNSISIAGSSPVTLSEGTGIHIVQNGDDYEVNISGLTSSNINDFNSAVDARISISALDEEQVIDIMSTGLFGGTGIHLSYDDDGTGQISLNVSGLTLSNITDITASATEVNYLDGSTPGSATASNVLVVDANKDIDGIRNLSIDGNLTVNGTTTTVESTVTKLRDPVITLGSGDNPTSDDDKDRGIEFNYYFADAARIGFFGFDDSTRKFTFLTDATNTNEVFTGTKGEVDANVDWSNILNKPDPVITGELTGDATGISSATFTDLSNVRLTINTSISNLSVTKLSASGITLGNTTINLGETSTVIDGLTRISGASLVNPVYLYNAIVDGGSP